MFAVSILSYLLFRFVTAVLSRIVEPANVDGEGDLNKELHDHTYGIASDPLTQLGIVLR